MESALPSEKHHLDLYSEKHGFAQWKSQHAHASSRAKSPESAYAPVAPLFLLKKDHMEVWIFFVAVEPAVVCVLATPPKTVVAADDAPNFVGLYRDALLLS